MGSSGSNTQTTSSAIASGNASAPSWYSAYTEANGSAQFQEFLSSAAGSQYANTIAQAQQVLNTPITSGPNVSEEASSAFNFGEGLQVSDALAAFQTWQAGNTATQTNWQNYADQANANAGGEGDQTITQGAAVSQRNQILGSLANPNAPTSPSVGLGQLGANATLNNQKTALGTGVSK